MSLSNLRISFTAIPHIIYTSNAFAIEFQTPNTGKNFLEKLDSIRPPNVEVKKLHPRTWRKLVNIFSHVFQALLMWSHTLDLKNLWCYLQMNHSRSTPQLRPLCGLNLASLYLSISCRLDFPGFIALTPNLHNKAKSFRSTRPNPPYLF